jgi:hypothetical protein
MAMLMLQPDATSGEDTMVWSGGAANNYGILDRIDVGRGNSADITRGFIRFDISSLPAGATLTAANLFLYHYLELNTIDRNVSVHRSLVQWYEGNKNGAAPDGGVDGSTYNHRNAIGSVAWGASGGLSGTDYAAVATSTVSITTTGQFFSWNVLADVQAWYDASATNYGWWLIGDQSTNGTIKRFRSSDHSTAGERPYLEITYTVAATVPPLFQHYARLRC